MHMELAVARGFWEPSYLWTCWAVDAVTGRGTISLAEAVAHPAETVSAVSVVAASAEEAQGDRGKKNNLRIPISNQITINEIKADWLRVKESRKAAKSLKNKTLRLCDFA